MKRLEQIELQLLNQDSEVRINALFDAYEYNELGINLIAQALKDKIIKVRQVALFLLNESEFKIAKKALWNHLPFLKMQCLHTIENFDFDAFDIEDSNLDYFAIADYSNCLVSYWDITYKASGVAIWDLETGKLQKDFYLTAHDFGLGKKGKIFISSYQDIIMPPQNIETNKLPNNYLDGISKMRGVEPMGFAVSKNNTPLVSVIEAMQTTKVESDNKTSVISGKLKIWNYETYLCLLDYEFKNLVLPQDNYFKYSIKNSNNFLLSPLTFTSKGEFLVVCLIDKHKKYVVKIWDIEATKLIQTISELPRLTIISTSINLSRTIIACGIREEKICVWELQTDKIIFTIDENCPCILSDNGRILIYATAKYEIVVRDLIDDRELCRLIGHNSPIAYLALSTDYEFIVSYSIDKKIKIWGIPNIN